MFRTVTAGLWCISCIREYFSFLKVSSYGLLRLQMVSIDFH